MIIWNHRWEYDKNPEFFFEAMEALRERNRQFSLAIMGEKYDIFPDIFSRAKDRFEDVIKVYGYLESKHKYMSWLKKGSIVISCSTQENFGISVVEAVRFGCMPLLPDRLSYPEIIPEVFHSTVLYRTKENLIQKIEDILKQPEKYVPLRKQLSDQMEKFSWRRIIKAYDDILEKTVLA